MTTLVTPPGSLTRNGLLPEARHLVLPRGIKSSGFPAVRETCRQIGIEFDQWEQDLNKALLAKDGRGRYAADTAVMSIARQVGKTYDIGAVAFALCIAIPGLTVVWTAHRFKVARESFTEMRSWAKRKELAPHIDYDAITTAAGNECIPFRNGSRIVFAARERGAIRGFTKVGMLVLDEAQILTETAMADLVPTTNQAPNPLIILMGTPPKPNDPSEVFTRLRQDALDGESTDILYVELSAEPGCDPSDRKQWAIANPSYPRRTPARAILRMKKLLSRDDFMREGLGVWHSGAAWEVIDGSLWAVLADPKASMADPVALGVWVSPDRDRAAIAAAGGHADGQLVEITGRDAVGLDARPGVDWLTVRLDALAEHRPLVVVTNDRVLADTGRARLATGPDQAAASALLYDSVRAAGVHHLGQGELTQSAAGAIKRVVGQGWVWDAPAGTDVCPVGAASLALWGLLTPRVHEERKGTGPPQFAHV